MTSSRSSEIKKTAGWQWVDELLEGGEYSQVAQLLAAAHDNSEQAGHTVLADILAAARVICLACSHCRTDVDRHRQALDESSTLERELREELQILLNFVRADEPTLESTATIASLTVPGADHQGTTATRSALWQRIRKVFRAGSASARPSSVSQSGETRVDAAEESQAGPVEEVGTTAVSAAGDAFAAVSRAPREVPAAPTNEPAQRAPTVLPTAEPPPPSTLAVYCLGTFRTYQNNDLVTEWSGLKGQTILKYLAASYQKPVPKDVLMDTVWPDADPDAARRNLHQAVYNLRETLRHRDPDFQHVLFENDCYLLNPEMHVWIDYKEFEERIQAGRRLAAGGRQTEAMFEYGIAESIYQGDFLEEDLYEEWPQRQRERLRRLYLEIADQLSKHYLQQGEYTAAIGVCQKVLDHDRSFETAHRRLMRGYLAQGQRHLAVRQYHTCTEILKEELDVTPTDKTNAVYERIRSTV